MEENFNFMISGLSPLIKLYMQWNIIEFMKIKIYNIHFI